MAPRQEGPCLFLNTLMRSICGLSQGIGLALGAPESEKEALQSAMPSYCCGPQLAQLALTILSC